MYISTENKVVLKNTMYHYLNHILYLTAFHIFKIVPSFVRILKLYIVQLIREIHLILVSLICNIDSFCVTDVQNWQKCKNVVYLTSA